MYMRKYLKMEPGKERDGDPQTEDLRNMLMTFRISELQEVLCACGRPRSGRKHELLGRALSLLKQSEGSSLRQRVKNRIIELYQLRFPTRVLPASLSAQSLYSSLDTTEKKTRDKTPTSVPPLIPSRMPAVSRQDNSNSSQTKDRPSYSERVGNRSSSTASLEKSFDRSTSHHDRTSFDTRNAPQTSSSNSSGSDSLSRQINRPSSNRVNGTEPGYSRTNGNPCHDGMPVHPDVRIINLPFAEIQDVLIKPTSLVKKRISGYQDIGLVFHLSPLQVQTITHSRSFTLQSRVEYSVQVLLRFCLAETSCVQEDAYPSRCSIKVNGKICPIPGQPPSNSQNLEPKKPHRPVNITSFCRLSPMMANQVQISWLPSDLCQRYAATVQLVKCVTSSSLTQRLKAKPERNSDHARALIKEKLAHDPENEVATTSLKVSLCCPIGRTRMTLPCRSTTCNHVQCFDGSLYIQMNERKPNWTCPVCDQKAYYDQLIVDGLFTEILRLAPDTNDIVFSQDGSWKPLSDNDQDSKVSITTIVGTPLKIEERSSKDREFDTIDLTLDSSEDEEVPKPSTRPIGYPAPLNLRGPRVRQVPMVSSTTLQQYSTFAPLFDPEGADFYSMIPDEDRIAAELYLTHTGLLSQLTNNTSRHSPSDVISLD